MRGAHIRDAVNDDRLRNDAHPAVNIEVPCQAQPGDILIVDLLERAEVLRLEVPPIDQPVCSSVRFRNHAEVCEIRIIATARHKVVNPNIFKRNPVELKTRDRLNTGHLFLTRKRLFRRRGHCGPPIVGR